MADTPSPPARRLQSPSWLDLRLVFGVLMVLVAVLLGARIVAGSDRSTRVWQLTHDVAAGTALTDADVHTMRVRLYGDTDRFVGSAVSPLGQSVNRDLSSGDLLPRAALGRARSGVLVPLPVPVSNLPADVSAGDRIAVYAGPRNGAAQGTGGTTPVLSDLVVQSIADPGGELGGADVNRQLMVEVYSAVDARTLISAVAGSTLYVVQQVGAQSGGGRSSDAPPQARAAGPDWRVNGSGPSPVPSSPSPAPSPSR